MSPKIILLVEDDEDIRSALAETLLDENYTVIEAIDGQDALKKLEATTELPKLILLDLMMPRLDGIGFRKKQLEDARLTPIPVILFSADPKAEQKAAEYKIDHCLRKPIDLDQLMEVIGKYF